MRCPLHGGYHGGVCPEVKARLTGRLGWWYRFWWPDAWTLLRHGCLCAITPGIVGHFCWRGGP